MDSLTAVLVSLRRGVRRALPAAVLLVLGGLVAVHAARPVEPSWFAGFIVAVLALVAVRAHGRAALVDPARLRAREIELGGLVAVAAYAAVVHVDGGVDGPTYPLVFLAIGVTSAFARPAVCLLVVLGMMAFEVALRFVFGGVVLPRAMLVHLGFALAFGLLHALSLRVEVARLRKASHRQLDAERQRIRDEARSYRLLRAPRAAGGGEDDEVRLYTSGVEEIKTSVLLSLRLLREGLGLYTVILLWLEDGGDRLRISELVSEDGDLEEGPFSTRDGILGAVVTKAAPVCVADLKPGYLLPYYREVGRVRSVCAVPVLEHGALRGVLVADRGRPDAFAEHEVALVEQAARFSARAIENERVFVQLERTKVEQGKLYRAVERLAAATTEDEVVGAGVESASEIAAVDFAAFTAWDPGTARHHIGAVVGELADKLTGKSFVGNTGLCSMALANRHPLPWRGDYDPSQQIVFARGLEPPRLPSLLVLPLVVHDQPLGTLVLGSREKGAFHEGVRGLLEVLGSHLAVSLSNARMVRRLEEQATTDGLTGLLNKRALLACADRKLAEARRFGRQLSVLVADIDHFKRVNDTWGHDVGDLVIKGLAAIHDRNKRNTDAVARFGGEEFVTLCDETDSQGALLLAERIRTELARTPFRAGGESIHCTCSIGIATYPEAGASWAELFKAADAALYASKRAGRDRVTVWQPRHAA
jgi:diguanylate cyclase (GGDEF)-like protein